MDDMIVVHVSHRRQNLSHEYSDFFFAELKTVDQVEQIPPLTEFSYHIDPLVILIDVIELDYVGVVHLL